MQKVITGPQSYEQLEESLKEMQVRSILLVHGRSYERLPVKGRLDELAGRLGIRLVSFTGFHPNPDLSSVRRGTALLRQEQCDLIAAIGGGSAMDVAKGIRLFAGLDPESFDPGDHSAPGTQPLLAIPTTAGSGSEATRFAVIYRDGQKLSLTDDCCLPDIVLLDGSLLSALPDAQRRSTMLDALCHGIESYWSVHSTPESRELSLQAIRQVLAARNGYLANTPAGNEQMLQAAHLAGQAINLTQTTAGHAMCYKLTGLYGLSHGSAAALCVRQLWPWMLCHRECWMDPRGQAHFELVFTNLAHALGAEDQPGGAAAFDALVSELVPQSPVPSLGDLDRLTATVNPDRLKNHPARLDEQAIRSLYRRILKINEE